MTLVLASGSPRRERLLRFLLDDFEVRPVDVDENAPRRLQVEEALEVIARKKAMAASMKDKDAWVLGADTIIWYRGHLLGKARSRDEARLRLATLAGEEHQVSTGIALAHGGHAVDARAVTTTVRMDRIPPDIVDTYVREEQWRGKAGGYGIQDTLLAPFMHIEGPWSNVVGLPLAATADLLRDNDIPCRDPPDEVWLSDHNPFDARLG